MMKAIRYWMLIMIAMSVTLLPLYSASAWDYSSGHRGGGGYHGYRGGSYNGYHGGYRSGGYHGGYRGSHQGGRYRGYYGGGCWGCDSVGAGIVGLTIGTIIGSAMVEASRPPVVVQSLPPPSGRCTSVIVEGVTYYNCSGGRDADYNDW